jgi:hypothetical protein
MKMKWIAFPAWLFIAFTALTFFVSTPKPVIKVTPAVTGNKLSADWLNATRSRISKETFDSLTNLKRNFSSNEINWLNLLKSRSYNWKKFPDSLILPFGSLHIPDTIIVLAGHSWVDDAFTFGLNTVCFDLTALQQNYGDAGSAENLNRIDRLFAHECMHLFSKKWLQQKPWTPANFQDSIVFECWYEGLGMYRSLSKKWLPEDSILPPVTLQVLDTLIPRLKHNLNRIYNPDSLSTQEKQAIFKNLSRGNIHQKWGAFPIAIWLALEAKGDDRNLSWFVSEGPPAVHKLIGKYIPEKQ